MLAQDDPVSRFNREIIDATSDLCVAYKLNLAFYEAAGHAGGAALEKTLAYIPDSHLKIADAKRGDIGNTSNKYAQAFFEQLSFDAVTIAPYMGRDSVAPFLAYTDKWTILLALTSNPSSVDFQKERLINDRQLFEVVLEKAKGWGSAEQLMFVIGATHPELFTKIRSIVPNHFLLVPGVGAQGGDLRAISEKGFNEQVGILVNAARSIIYAGSGPDFAAKAREAAQSIQEEMAVLIERRYGV